MYAYLNAVTVMQKEYVVSAHRLRAVFPSLLPMPAICLILAQNNDTVYILRVLHNLPRAVAEGAAEHAGKSSGKHRE